MFAMMAIIAIIECGALIASVVLSGTFREIDAEAFRYFSGDAEDRTVALDTGTGRFIQNAATTAEAISEVAQRIAEQSDGDLQSAYLDDSLYNELTDQCSTNIVEFLHGNAVSAAFFILNGSNTHKEEADAHSAVYIRNSAPGVTDEGKSLQLEVGPINVSRARGIATGTRWSLDMHISSGSKTAAYYENPIEAAEEYPRAELVRCGYWSPPVVILPGKQDCISYTLPLRDSKGQPWGVMGFELTLSLFTKDYLPTEGPYPGSFYAVTSCKDNELDTSWIIPGSPSASRYLRPDDPISLRLVEGTNVYETNLVDTGAMYCAMNELTMYSKNSPFADEHWVLIGMVEQSVLNQASERIARSLYTNMALTLAAAFVAIFLITWLSTRRITGLSQYVDGLGPAANLNFRRTNLREIDDLTAAIERLNRRINDSLKVTSKMMELTQLPLGGFEVPDDMDTVMLTEYVYKLLGVGVGEVVSKGDWQRMYAELTAHPADGYANVYRYDAQSAMALQVDKRRGDATGGMMLRMAAGENANDMYVASGREKWLRIIEARGDNGTVGMILDCTSDIDHLMHLAHELDYDALTHLYNRTAFKRESFKRINDNPSKIGAMIFSDLDNLKYMNDTYGHRAGDDLIITAADLFRRFVGYGGIVARISGDEFAIFLYGFSSKQDALRGIRTVFREFSEATLTTPDGKVHALGCSSGLAWYPDDSTDISDLLKLSDYAMYEAKRENKGSLCERDGTIIEFDEDFEDQSVRTRKRREALEKILGEDGLDFRFQPIVELETGEIRGYEALMTPKKGAYKTPRQVLAAARAESKLAELEGAVIRKVMQRISENREIIGERNIYVHSIPGHYLDDVEWEKIVEKYGDLVRLVVFEVTESENDDLEKMLEKLNKLRELGISIALNDFGHGYSNEARIVAMHPAYIKMQLRLVQDLEEDDDEAIRQLIAFAHGHGIKVIISGVERDDDLYMATRFGVDCVEGYLLGRPEYGFEPLSAQVRKLLDECKEGHDPLS